MYDRHTSSSCSTCVERQCNGLYPSWTRCRLRCELKCRTGRTHAAGRRLSCLHGSHRAARRGACGHSGAAIGAKCKTQFAPDIGAVTLAACECARLPATQTRTCEIPCTLYSASLCSWLPWGHATATWQIVAIFEDRLVSMKCDCVDLDRATLFDATVRSSTWRTSTPSRCQH
jgi:hypothetical protein